jgi:hypothetical protein
MESSIDRWDEASLDEHIQLLELLSYQTTAYELYLNKDLDQLPAALEQARRSGAD